MRRKFRKRERTDPDFDLQVTSLADILIIVLVFLLKSYSTDVDREVSIPQDISIPEVASAGITDEGLRIEISESRIMVAGDIVTSLNSYRFHPNDLLGESSAEVPISKSLNIALRRGKKDIWKEYGVDKDGNKREPKVWIIADRRMPYQTLQTVLSSAATNGYSDFNLAVVKEE